MVALSFYVTRGQPQGIAPTSVLNKSNPSRKRGDKGLIAPIFTLLKCLRQRGHVNSCQ